MTVPLTDDGRPMKRYEGGWCDPDCGRCQGRGYVEDDPGFYEVCDTCWIDGRDVLNARDYCPPLEELA